MAIIYHKRHPHIVNNAKEAAKGKEEIHDCPQCGNEANIVEKYRDRATYKCTKCKAVSTYSIHPGDVQRIKKNNKYKGVLVRDRSKEVKEKEIEDPKEENIEKKEQALERENTMGTIREAMSKVHLLKLNYVSKSGEKSNRSVEPYKIIRDRHGDIILYAYCVEKKGIRVFKLKGITGIKLTEESFDPRWALEDKLKDDNGK